MISGPVPLAPSPSCSPARPAVIRTAARLRADAADWAGPGPAPLRGRRPGRDAGRRGRAGPGRGAAGALTFAGAAGRTGAVAVALREAGVRRGDLVVVTARTTPPYLLCWLALASLGAVSVATNPRSAPAELAGWSGRSARAR